MKTSQKKKIKKRKEWVKMRNVMKNNISKVPRPIRMIGTHESDDDITVIKS